MVAVDAGPRARHRHRRPSCSHARRRRTLEAAFIALLPEERRRGPSSPRSPLPIETGDVAIEAEGPDHALWRLRCRRPNCHLRVRRGEIFGFLGSNGCGKSTTMKMLTGLLEPSAGEALLLGRRLDAGNIETRRRVGYMSQSFSLYGELSVRQNLDLHAAPF